MEDLGGARNIEYIRKGMAELSVNFFIIIHGYQSDLKRFKQTWDWRFGQTPEFTQTLKRKFQWGAVVGLFSTPVFFPLTTNSHQTVEIRSKHGLISDCSLQLTGMSTTSESLKQWARSFYQGKRYGFLHETGQGADLSGGLHPLRSERSEPILDVKAWLEDAVQCNFDGSS